MKPVGVPGAFCADVDPPAFVVPVAEVGAVVPAGAVVVATDEGAVEFGVVATEDGAVGVVESEGPVTPALRGDDEL